MNDYTNIFLGEELPEPFLLPEDEPTPDVARRHLGLARDSGYDIPVVRDAEEEIKRRLLRDSIDIETIDRETPVLGRQLRDFRLRPALLDDIEGMTAVERGAQHVLELVKGPVPGAIKGLGLGLTGLAARTQPAWAAEFTEAIPKIASMSQAEVGDLRRKVQASLGVMERAVFQGIISDILEDPAYAEEIYQEFTTPLAQTPLHMFGESVKDVGEAVLPPKPGFEQSFSRQIGEGLGSVGTGIGAHVMGGPAGAFLLFLSMGAGEAEEAARRAGATEEQIRQAARLGSAAGATDVAPVELLFKHVPAPSWLKTVAAQVVGRVGLQAVVEGVQEGGQQFLQNLIAREIYDPDKPLMEGVLDNAIAGATVGAAVGALTEVLLDTPVRDRSRRPPKPERDRAVLDQRREQHVREQVAIDELIEGARSSTVLAQDPVLFQELTAETLGAQEIYIPVDAIQADPEVAAEFLQAVPAAAEQMGEALASGGDLVLPAGDVIAAMGRSESLEALRPAMRLTPEAADAGEHSAAVDHDLARAEELIREEETARVQGDTLQRQWEVQIQEAGKSRGYARQTAQALRQMRDRMVGRLTGEARTQAETRFAELLVQHEDVVPTRQAQVEEPVDETNLVLESILLPEEIMPVPEVTLDDGTTELAPLTAAEALEDLDSKNTALSALMDCVRKVG